VREAAATSGWLLAHGWIVGGAVIAGAGAFQFSELTKVIAAVPPLRVRSVKKGA